MKVQPESENPRARSAVAAVGPLVGTLLIFPAVLLWFGRDGSWETRVPPARAEHHLLRRTKFRVLGTRTAEARFFRAEEGTRASRGMELRPGGSIELAFDPPIESFALLLQGDADSGLTVLGSSDGEGFDQLWRVPRVPDAAGLVTRRSPILSTAEPCRSLRVELAEVAPETDSDEGIDETVGFVSYVAVMQRAFAIPRWLAPMALWLGALALVALRSRSVAAARGWALWRRADPWLAAVLIYAVLFRVPRTLVLAIALLTLLAALLHLVRRFPAQFALVFAGTWIAYVLFVPRFSSWLAARVASAHQMTVDHRMKPGEKGANADGIRFAGEADDVAEEDFVILFMGDSFTYGWRLEYEESYPQQVDRILSARDCSPPVRIVNFGWTSSSPILGLRLLREIGRKYKPDLIVYNLDMTDFHDDLRYEEQLVDAGDLTVEPAELIDHYLQMRFPALALDSSYVRAFLQLLRSDDPSPEAAGGARAALPEDRYFATRFPLEETRPAIERGVVKNLALIEDFARETLACPMVVVLYPRAYQYSRTECADNWEAYRYEVLGPYVLEPFRYFAEAAAELPYGVIDLLPAFEASDEFPLFLDEDPHWNAAGARFTAEQVARVLVERGLVPYCPVSSGPETKENHR